ncbi:MAG: hypothetical protein WCH01_00455 [Methylococcaceae bacterium]
MSVIVKYLIDFPGADFKVSNDLFKGDFIIDANVVVSMNRGKVGSQFTIDLYDLPEEKSKKLGQAKTAKDAGVVIKLGYMDGEFETVTEGVFTKVMLQVKGENLVTTITGDESGAYALKTTRQKMAVAGQVTVNDILEKLMKEAFPATPPPTPPTGILGEVAALFGNETKSDNLIDKVPNVQNILVELKDVSVTEDNLMAAVGNLAAKVGSEFLVCDKKIFLGMPIKNDTYQPKEFDRDVNLAEFRPMAQNLPGKDSDNRLLEIPPHQTLGFSFIVTGDPKLRPGQKVSANIESKVGKETQSFRKNDQNQGEFRIHTLEHNLSMTGGYYCKGQAVKTCSEKQCRDQQQALGLGNPDRIAEKLSQNAKDERRKNPSIEIGRVKQYNIGDGVGDAPHRSTLYFGQNFDNSETQPSIRAEVEVEDNHLLLNKPIASPFAWHKCGLVVPVYQGMKALLAHNLNLPDDALVTGFLWSEKPNIEPPKNHEGDWWLCLPIDFDSSSPPKDDTKAANDLISNNGKRVIQVKGLKITIGTKMLSSVGTRPKEGEDNEFLIEHTSGTKLHIASDGSLSIEASKISIKGNVTIEGNVEIK